MENFKKNKTMYISFFSFLIIGNIYMLTPLIFLSKNVNRLNPNKQQVKAALSLYRNPASCFKVLITTPTIFSTWFKLMFFIILISALAMIVIKNLDFGNQVGVNYMKEDGTQGTANWMDLEETKKVLDTNSNKGILFGTVKNGHKNELITLSDKKKKASFFLNRNVAVFGASGSMKSRSFVRPNVMQIVQMQQSMVITDPKGELFESTAEYLKKNGYTVRVLNLVNMIHSDRWNPITEVTDDISAQSFVETVMANTKTPGAKIDEFWEKTEMNLLKALVLYVVKENPKDEKNLAAVYSLLALNDAGTIDSIFRKLSNSHPAKMPYNIYSQASDNVRTGVVIGLGTKLQVFQSKIVQDLTSTSDIDLELPKKEKCAYFCITSDMESTFDFIAGLFFSFLFIKLTKYADYAPKKGQKDVYFILDEFPNIGAIPDFTKKISVMRSRGLSSFVIFQNIAQLKNRYPNDAWAEIIGNCDSRLFLGATDMVTAKFVSDLLGVSTVRSVSKKKEAGIEGIMDFGSLTISSQKRNLLNPDEILRLDPFSAILILKGQKPLLLEKMDYTKHKEASKLENINIRDYKVEWAEKYYEKQLEPLNPISIAKDNINENIMENDSNEDGLFDDYILDDIPNQNKDIINNLDNDKEKDVEENNNFEIDENIIDNNEDSFW